MINYTPKRKWIYDKSEEKGKVLKNLRGEPRLANLSDNALELLYNRGFRTSHEIEKLLYSNIDDIYDTRLLRDAEKAVAILEEAVLNKWTIVNYSDYDSDGICSSAINVLAIRNLGGNIHYYTNNRFVDGYGICPAGVDEIKNKYPDVKLIITTDNGIVAHEGVNRAKELGIKVVITDHHEPGDSLPSADAIVNPKRKDCTYPFKGLCGAGVIFKLMLLLYWEMDADLGYVYDMLDIVAVATVGDIVPLEDENRIFVREGIKKIKNDNRCAFKALRELTNVTNIDTETFGFIYVPILNAIGRLQGDCMEAIAMLISNDFDFAKTIATKLIEINEKRKALTEEQTQLAEKILESKGLKEVIVLQDDAFHEGIVGLIAGRLKEKYNRPAIVLTNHKGRLKGSARSIPGFHLFESLTEIKDNLLGFGGHAMAAGLSVSSGKLNEFESSVINLAKTKLKEEDYVHKVYIDVVLNAKTMNVKIIDEIDILKPFGEGFSKPMFGLSNFQGDKVYYMGDNSQHVKIVSNEISVLMWNQSEKYKNLREPLGIKAVGQPSINVYNNNVSLQFIVSGGEFVKV